MANCSVEETKIDRDSVDVQFRLRDKHTSRLSSPYLDAQMKAYACEIPAQATHVAYDLKSRNYNDLVQRSCTPRILVVLCLPKKQAEWAACTADSLILRRRALWYNMRGLKPTTNKTKERIQLPVTQVFDPNTLLCLLEKVARQEDLVL